MKSKQKNNTKNKKTYEKPGLRIIELETDQVLAVGCKLVDGGSAPTAPANCVDLVCVDAGS